METKCQVAGTIPGRVWGMVGRLSDCVSKRPEASEVFIVWSEEVGDSVKVERDRMTQAVLTMPRDLDPEADFGDLLDNGGVRALIASLGIGVSSPWDESEGGGNEFIHMDQLRYNKVIITLLPGEDGRILVRKLINFMYRCQRPLIQNGHVYLAVEALGDEGSASEFAEKVVHKDTRHLKQIKCIDTWLETLAALD